MNHGSLFEELFDALLCVVNVITALFGLALLGAGSYGLATFEQWSQFISEEGLIVVVVFGVAVFFVSIAGCCGAIKQNKWLLAIYGIVMFLVAFLLLGGGIAVLMYGDNICSTCENKLAAREISNIILKTYKSCCGANKGKAPNADTVCEVNPAADGEAAIDQLYKCAYPKFNDQHNDINPGCVKVFYDLDKIEIPTTLCKSIEVLVFNKDPADLTEWSSDNEICTQTTTRFMGSPEALYNSKVAKFLEDNMKTIGTGLVALASFLVALMIMACGVCCHKRDDFDPKQNQAAYDPTEAQAQAANGGNLAYGGGPVRA